MAGGRDANRPGGDGLRDGFRQELEKLVGHLGVLDERGWPHATGEKPAAERLRFIGFVPRPSQIGFAAKQARRAARAIARELR
ncbi:hypothetical protein [Rhodococcus koreensis]|uniref:hypothetical protein n=1 Tax=Rhodococcus koreensis TaxID=99653 RepID=UPI003CC527BD